MMGPPAGNGSPQPGNIGTRPGFNGQMWSERAPSLKADVTDWRLVEDARGGQLQAFDELVRRYEQPLIAFIWRMTGSREDAEDLAQETFVRVYRYLERLRPDAKFSTVLFGIGRNLTLNYIRDGKRRGRGRMDSLSQPDGQELALADPAPAPDAAARENETYALIQRGLALLSAEHREVLLLREAQGLDYDAIAEVIGCRKGTVKSRIARAREQLRARLLELGGELP